MSKSEHINEIVNLINEPSLKLQRCADGVWLHFHADNKFYSINLANLAKRQNTLGSECLLAWCKNYAANGVTFPK